LFTAPVEANAIIDILKEIRPIDGELCEIQILSPYNDQLALIRKTIDEARQSRLIDHMFRSPFDLRVGKRMGATVDEFQGSEADIVIVSLVRNNGLVPWKSIGFLKEPNRMNVLLSRARHKLIIVGSWQFFSSRCDENTSPDDEYAYIGRMMSVMDSAFNQGTLGRYPRQLR
jgi:superfamily I DNA and/or RNA helicase